MIRAHKQATQKQTTALQLINQGMSKQQAMLKAGYSKYSAQNPKRLMQSQAITNIVDKVRIELISQGLTTAYMVQKLKQFLEAGKRDPGDYKVQLEALKILQSIHGIEPKEHKEESIARRITLEEFITGNSRSSDLVDANTDSRDNPASTHVT